jgi:predicted enzyme related to lactoylglutathione lyase
MSNPPGTPIWYELVTPDPDGATGFYEHVVGWKIGEPPTGAPDYRMIGVPGGAVGGVLPLTDDMKAAGARPTWLLYLGVEDVDATAEKALSIGAHIFVPPTDIPGVGRFALLADPQGAPFYIMRSDSDQTSTAYAPGKAGHCGWNELCTPDFGVALGFYAALFGWENRDTMNMGPMGDYHFLHAGSLCIGAAAETKDQPAHWNLYFIVPDIDIAVERVRAGGGSIEIGPIEVPSGDRILHGTDPQAAHFALVAHPKRA